MFKCKGDNLKKKHSLPFKSCVSFTQMSYLCLSHADLISPPVKDIREHPFLSTDFKIRTMFRNGWVGGLKANECLDFEIRWTVYT